MRPEDSLKAELICHDKFFYIALKHNEIIKRLIQDRDRRDVKTDDDAAYIALKNAEIENDAMVVVVFCALALEAFINYYAIESLSRNYLSTYLDKLDPVSKWVVIPHSVTGSQIDTDGQAFERLRALFGLRNKLSHYKFRRKTISELNDDDWVSEKHSDDAIMTVRSIMYELQKIDGSLDVTWIESPSII